MEAPKQASSHSGERRFGVAFEGCACKAAFHVGVALSLTEAGIPIDIASGTSSGSLIAAAMASGRTRELLPIWLSLGGRSIVSFRRFLWNRSIFDMSSIVRTSLRDAFGAGDLRRAPGEALAVATRAHDLRQFVFSSRHEEDFVEPLLASCFIPPLYGRPVRIRGDWFLDGGFTDNLPLEALVQGGARHVVAVVTSPHGMALKSPSRRRWAPVASNASVHVIHPLRRLTIGYWDFRLTEILSAIGEGRRASERFVAQHAAGQLF